MAIKTSIEWCDSSLNLQMGCDGCELWNLKDGVRACYAGVLTERYSGNPGWPVEFGTPKLFPERLDAALKWPDLTGTARPDKPHLNGLPRLIFLNDMGDTFTESLPLDWLAPLLPQMATAPHVWMVLTKRPARMRRFFEQHPCPTNFWLYTSVTNQTMAVRIRELVKIDAPVRGISAEPLRSHLDLSEWLGGEQSLLQHVIAGGESGDRAQPMNPEWPIALQRQCAAAGVPYFFKQWGEWAPTSRGEDPSSCFVAVHGIEMERKGKKASGRLLVGREWSGFPLVTP